jgi:hypothetical protein
VEAEVGADGAASAPPSGADAAAPPAGACSPCLHVSDNIHPEDELGLTNVRHAELVHNGSIRRLN